MAGTLRHKRHRLNSNSSTGGFSHSASTFARGMWERKYTVPRGKKEAKRESYILNIEMSEALRQRSLRESLLCGLAKAQMT